MRRVFVLYSQPIRFARFDGKSVNRGLPVLDQARPELSIPATGQKDRGLWGREWVRVWLLTQTQSKARTHVVTHVICSETFLERLQGTCVDEVI